MTEELWVVGDPQGFLSPVQRVLRENGLVDADGNWLAGASTLVVVGDLVDRGPDGLGVIDFLMRVQARAPRQGGRVVVLIGNHDILLLAARRFGGPFMTDWLESGGLTSDLEGLGDAHVAWLTDLPALVVEHRTLLMHADAMFYLDYGSSVSDVNAAFRRVLASDDADAWERLLERFEEHRAFLDPFGEGNLQRYLHAFAVERVIHGHTPVPRMLHIAPETATSAYVYRGGRCVNVDPGIYLGGPGFAYNPASHTLPLAPMSMSASDDPLEAMPQGEILKASSPGPDQVQVDMEVMSLDGERVGKVKAIHPDEFLVDRHLARDLWIPFSAMLAAEDYNPNFRRGPAEGPSVVLSVTHAHVDRQGWRHD